MFKLPVGFILNGEIIDVDYLFGTERRLMEATVRHCAKVAIEKVGIREQTPDEISLDILSEFGLEQK